MTERGRAVVYGVAGALFGLASLRQLLAALRETDPGAKVFPAAYAVIFLLLCGSCLALALARRGKGGGEPR